MEETSKYFLCSLSLFSKDRNKTQLLFHLYLKYHSRKHFKWDCLFCSQLYDRHFFQISREKLPHRTAGISKAAFHITIFTNKKNVQKVMLFYFTLKYSSQNTHIAFYYFCHLMNFSPILLCTVIFLFLCAGVKSAFEAVC